METKRISEVMIPLQNYPHVHGNQSLKEAIREMESHQIEFLGKSTLPRVILVFDKDHQLTGIARRRDIMKGLEPEFLVSKPLSYGKNLYDVEVDPNLSEMSYDKLLKGILDRSKRPVSDIMLPVKLTISHDDHITKAIYEMVDRNLSLLPVIRDDRVVGVVRSVDIFRELSSLVLESEEVK